MIEILFWALLMSIITMVFVHIFIKLMEDDDD